MHQRRFIATMPVAMARAQASKRGRGARADHIQIKSNQQPKMEPSDDDEVVPGTAPEALLSPSLLDDSVQDEEGNYEKKQRNNEDESIPSAAANNQHQQHNPSQTEQEASESGSSNSNQSGSHRFPILLGPGSNKSTAVVNPSINSANADDGPQSSESPPPSQPSSNAVPVTDYKKERDDSSATEDGGDGKLQHEQQHDHEQDRAKQVAASSETTMISREEAIRSFNDSWPAFAAATAPRESEGIYAYSHRVPPSIAKLLGPPIKELDFESERKQWEQYRQQAREREAAAKAAAAAGAPVPDPGMEWAMATVREDEKFRQDGIRMQERQERWDRGEYSDHDSDDDENSLRAKIRKRLRKPGAPTIAELAVIMGLRPDPSAVANKDGEDGQDVVPEKKQTLLAPLPDPTREWQKSRKGGKGRSSNDSGSGSDAQAGGGDTTAAIAAHSSTDSGKRSKSKESASGRKKKKYKKSSGTGAGSSFMDKLRKKKKPKDHRNQNGDTQTDEEDDDAYPTKPSSNISGGGRIFDQTPKRRGENLSQTSIQEMFGSRK